MAEPMTQIAPGTRISVRGEEWLVRGIDRTSTGAEVFGVVGLSPLVEGREARFIREIEEANAGIEIVDPRNTRAVPDASPNYREARLMLESHFRATTPESPDVCIGDRGAMDVMDFQLEPARLALSQPRRRILVADAVGLGKTIECGILLAELIKRGEGRRILVVTVKAMLTQFQKELWSRFSLPLVRLDSAGLRRVRSRIPANHNPFHYYDKSIISIDTLKQDGEYRTHLENAWWDVIVIDEAHNVAERGSGAGSHSLRSRTAKLLASRSDSLVLLSATPHDGRRESFASLMNMLNATAIKDPKNYGPEDIDGLFIRRFKKDVAGQIAKHFPERIVRTPKTSATGKEEAAYASLAELRLASMERRVSSGPTGPGKTGGRILFRTLLEKSLFSSPVACASTIRQRIKRLEKKDTPEARADIAELECLLEVVGEIGPKDFSKYQLLLRMLRPGAPESIGWNPKDPHDRLVVFTERRDTLAFLREHLAADLRLKPARVRELHGGLGDLEQQEIVEAFGSADSPVRLLVASDVASEGINLHHQCHRLIHFDIPWSLLVFQQRNGRIDRYGQTRQPEIDYLFTESDNPKIRGDHRILELLVEKDNEVQRNIGDPSEFTGLYTVEEEEEAVGRAIESGASDPAEALENTFSATSEADDWFDSLLAAAPAPGTAPPKPPDDASPPPSVPSLFENDFHWAREGFETLRAGGVRFQILEADETAGAINLSPPADLRRRLEKALPEIIDRETGLLSLSADRSAVMKEIDSCRAEEGRWPRLHLLWEQHPALRWMQDKLLAKFGRNQAACIHLPHLAPGERIVLGTGVIPNRKGHPLIQRWHGVRFLGGALKDTLSLPEVVERTRFAEDHPNPRLEIDPAPVEALFPEAVECLRIVLSEARDEFRRRTRPELDAQLAKLKQFLDARSEQLEFDFAQSSTKGLASTLAYRLAEKERKIREIRKIHEDYKLWITETMQTEDAPSIRLLAVFGNFES